MKNEEVTEGEAESKNVLVLVNVLSRKIWAQTMPNKTDKETASAMQTILEDFDDESELPTIISTDGGAEFKGRIFVALLRDMDIAQRLKDGQNALASVDRSIQSLKMTLAKMMATRHGSWQKMLPKAVKALNDTPKTVLHHAAPDDVEDDDQVKFMLLQDNARNIAKNKQVLARRKQDLEKAGAFRAPAEGLGRKTFKRGNDPSYGDKKRLEAIEGSTAVATDGTRIDVKHLKAVEGESTNAEARLGGGGESRSTNKKRQDSVPIKSLTIAYLSARETGSLNALAKYLKEHLRAATLTYQQILDKTKLTLVATLRLFPELFEVEDGRYVTLLEV